MLLIEGQWKKLKIPHAGNIPRIRSEFQICRHWVLSPEEPAPCCFSAPLAVSAFPGDCEESEGLAFRIAFLFAGVRNCRDALGYRATDVS